MTSRCTLVGAGSSGLARGLIHEREGEVRRCLWSLFLLVVAVGRWIGFGGSVFVSPVAVDFPLVFWGMSVEVSIP